MSAFSCEHCGAALELPHEDDDALDVPCAFCGQHTRVPADVLALRRRPVPPAARRGNPLAAVAGIVVALGLVVALVMRLPTAKKDPVVTRLDPIPSAVASASTPPRVTVTDRRLTGADAVSARLTELHARGCKDVILAPAQATGEQTLETKFVKSSGRCVTVLAMTGAPDNLLTIRMSTPLGAAIDVPPPSTRLELSVCPTMSGEHPTTISPRTEDPYTVAAIECPAPAGTKK